MAADLGLAGEFDRREGKQHGSGQRQPAKAQDGGRSHGHRQGGSNRGPNHQRKQGGGGSTGPKRRRRRRNPAGQSPRN